MQDVLLQVAPVVLLDEFRIRFEHSAKLVGIETIRERNEQAVLNERFIAKSGKIDELHCPIAVVDRFRA
ncbi:hypothetical protein D3H35_10005 [Cohnella faecalis]|uniref:Uncharacterized protein n=1 Tax=Cohnella faecalis TaxID=2315694 RepID=A0A398CXM2_9BACL|nr:hypothetical protein D3H35_10005 [Cohnella faecalis]